MMINVSFFVLFLYTIKVTILELLSHTVVQFDPFQTADILSLQYFNVSNASFTNTDTFFTDDVKMLEKRHTRRQLFKRNNLLDQRIRGNVVPQCPCVIKPGTDKCIAYDSRYQAASIEEALIAFHDVTMDDDSLKYPDGGIINAQLFACHTLECQTCAAVLLRRIIQIGMVPPDIQLSIPIPTSFDPRNCRRIRFIREFTLARPPRTSPFMKALIARGLQYGTISNQRQIYPTSVQQPAPVQPTSVQQPAPLQQPIPLQQSVPVQQPTSVQQPAWVQQPAPVQPTSVQQPAPLQQPIPLQQSVPVQQPTSVQQPAWVQQPAPVQPTSVRQPAPLQQPIPLQQSVPVQQPTSVQQPAWVQQSAPVQPILVHHAPVQQPAPLQQSAPLQHSVPVQQSASVQPIPVHPPYAPMHYPPVHYAPMQPTEPHPFLTQPTSVHHVPAHPHTNFWPRPQPPQFPQILQPPSSQIMPPQIVLRPSTPEPVQQWKFDYSVFLPKLSTLKSVLQLLNNGKPQTSPHTSHTSSLPSSLSSLLSSSLSSHTSHIKEQRIIIKGKSWFHSSTKNETIERKVKRKADQPVLGTRYMISCVRHGEVDDENMLALCGTCWTWRKLPSDYFPPLINELVCSKENEGHCLSGWGNCQQKYRNFDVLRNVNGNWQPTTISTATCCDCRIRAGTEIHPLIIGKRHN